MVPRRFLYRPYPSAIKKASLIPAEPATSIAAIPQAIQQEREALLKSGARYLRSRGQLALYIRDLAGFEEPPEHLIPVLNIPMRADLEAVDTEGSHCTLGVVEVASDLGEEACGRRWQALGRWAEDHRAELLVFVHTENSERARAIARAWHLDPHLIVEVPR